jgi:hypothetical protein
MELTFAPIQLTRFSHRYSTGSQPMVLYDAYENMYAVKFAEKAESGTLGLAREYLGGSLAELIEAPVPATTFVELSSSALSTDANISFNDGSRPAPQVTVASMYLTDATSPVTPMDFEGVPSEDVAGVLVFNTWVSVGDRHWGNYMIQTTTDGPHLVSIDYTTCLADAGATPTSVGDRDLLQFAKAADAAIDEYIRRLLAVSERRIRQAVSHVPSGWMSHHERERIVDFLLSGRLATERLVADAIAA